MHLYIFTSFQDPKHMFIEVNFLFDVRIVANGWENCKKGGTYKYQHLALQMKVKISLEIVAVTTAVKRWTIDAKMSIRKAWDSRCSC